MSEEVVAEARKDIEAATKGETEFKSMGTGDTMNGYELGKRLAQLEQKGGKEGGFRFSQVLDDRYDD